MSEVLAEIPLPSAGVHAEMNQNELPPNALHDSENWIFRDGRMRTRRGFLSIGDVIDGRPNGTVGYIDGTGEPVLAVATTDEVYVFDDATQDWIALSASFSGADSSSHTVFRVFQLGGPSGPVTTFYAHNGSDPGVKWQLGDAAVSAQGGNAPAAKAMMILADRMILGNLSDATGYTGALGPQVVAVSDSQDPESGWNTVLINQLSDTPGAIVAMQESGNLQGTIYKTDAVYGVTASESAVPFTFDLKKAGVSGPVSQRAVVAGSDGLQYYLARDGNVMVYDGIEPRPLGRHIQRYVLDTWDVNVFHKAFCLYDDENREFVAYYCGIGADEPNRAIKVRLDDTSLWPMRWATQRWTAAIKALLPGGTTIGDLNPETIFDLTLTLGEYDSLGQSFLQFEKEGQGYREEGSLDNAAPITAYFETGTSGLNDPMRFKSVRFIDHRFATCEEEQELNIALTRSNYGENVTYDSSRTLHLDRGGPYRTHHRYPGRKYGLRATASVVSEIEWQGSTVVYAVQGRR